MVNTGAATVTLGVGETVTVEDIPPPERLTGIDTGVPLLAVTVPVTVIAGKLCPVASESLRVQLVAVAVTVHVQPLPVMVAIVNPTGGSVTVTAPLVAAVPVFDTVIV
jgi:hypothetical protein